MRAGARGRLAGLGRRFGDLRAPLPGLIDFRRFDGVGGGSVPADG
ncbi:hypothetical protein [Saccharopolyspora shandongensis]